MSSLSHLRISMYLIALASTLTKETKQKNKFFFNPNTSRDKT